MDPTVEAKSFMLKYSKDIAKMIVAGKKMINIKESMYSKSAKPEIVRLFISLPDVEQAIPTKEGITVYLY